jgi:hypothetical protein
MTDPIDPVRRAAAPRPTRRDGKDRRGQGQGDERPDTSFPVTVVQETRVEPEPPPPAGAAFEAQLLGQGGQKRGLKGGKEVLRSARGAYLGAEYSGEADRRPKPGLVKKTEI